MWRYIECSKPPIKKKKTEEEKLEVDRQYDRNVRKRTFQASWSQDFKWVLHDGQDKVYCKPCRSCYSDLSISKLPDRGVFRKYCKGPFVTGCSNLKRSVLVDHDNSQGHILAVEHVDSRNKKTGESAAEKIVEKMNTAAFERLKILFRNAHVLAKNNRPFSDFTWLLQLDEKKGLHVGDTYRNDKACRNFIRAISQVEGQKLKKDIEETKFLTIISDGSTDVSVKENEAVYVRWCTRGVAETRFLSMQSTQKADAAGILAAIKASFNQLQKMQCDATVPNYFRKVVAFAADGASVNTGKSNGVIAKMRAEWSPSIVMVQCLAHRLELIFKDTFKKDKEYDKVITLLSNLYSFYHRSPLQRSGLETTFKALGKTAVMPTRIGGTRWMSHTLHSVGALWKGYKAFVLHLDQCWQTDSKLAPKAKGMLKMLRSKGVIAYGHFMQDLLSCLSLFSLELQKSDSSIYSCHAQLEATKVSLMKLVDSPGLFLQRQQTDPDHYQEETLIGSAAFSYPSATVTKLITALEDRYKDVSSDVLEATRIAYMPSWPLEIQNEFGDDYLQVLLDHWDDVLTMNDVNTGVVLSEWCLLKTSLYSHDLLKQGISWAEVNTKFKDKCPNILDVIDLVLCLPASSAECERGFSTMKLVKTDVRNKLSVSALTDSIRIHLNSPSVHEFDPSPAIHLWNSFSFRSRRPNQRVQKLTLLQELHRETMDPDTASGSGTSASGSAAAAAACTSDTAADDHDDDSDIDSLIESDISLSDWNDLSSDDGLNE